MAAALARDFSEKSFREEDDARTMARAEEIKGDAKRMAGARRGAKKMLVEKQKEVGGLKKVAGRKKA